MSFDLKINRHQTPPPARYLLTAALCLTGLAFTPACGGSDGAQQGDVQDSVAAPLEARSGAPSQQGLKRGARGTEVLKLYQYLRAYGYFPNSLLEKYPGWKPAFAQAPADPQVFDGALERALVLFQRTHGLPQDGVLNERTLQLMKQPRCGFPDSYHGESTKGFVTSGYRWNTRDLTYSISNYTPDMPSGNVQSAISGAFARWAAVAGLRFSQVGSGGNIAIGFYQGDHGDGNAFDGPSGVLAHAFYPTSSSATHFDEAETWSDNGTGTDLPSIALHEFGHSLGLAHSTDGGAVMYPYYTGIHRDLATDDIQGIRALYPNNVLVADKALSIGQSITSVDGRFTLVMQSDGNLVEYWNGHGPLWSTATGGSQGQVAVMQGDGNFVLYTPTGFPLWASNTGGRLGAFLMVQDDGNVVIYQGNNMVPVWYSGTGGH
jgi:peptidoglycan hydrolase-like protein with peptidoglycan-binding domain